MNCWNLPVEDSDGSSQEVAIKFTRSKRLCRAVAPKTASIGSFCISYELTRHEADLLLSESIATPCYEAENVMHIRKYMSSNEAEFAIPDDIRMEEDVVDWHSVNSEYEDDEDEGDEWKESAHA